MDNQITGVVAQILNSREVALNLGSERGVREGMRFQVLEKERSIVDPLTKEPLGALQQEKVRVKVVKVEPKFCIARTYETYQTSEQREPLEILRGMARAGLASETRVRTLKASDRPMGFEEIDEYESYVQVGDPVRLIESPAKEAATTADKQLVG